MSKELNHFGAIATFFQDWAQVAHKGRCPISENAPRGVNTKGQLISKGHFGFFNPPKKQTKNWQVG